MRKVLSKQSRMPTWFPLLLSVGMILAACGQKADKPRDRGVREHLVEVALVQSDNLNVVRTRTGTLRARREVKVYTQEEGRITALPLYEGDEVGEGDVLVRLDDTLIRAQLSRASATRKQAQEDVKRLKELRSRKLVSEDEYTRALTQLDVAQADEHILKTRLGYTTISSPINGVVSARFSEPGNVVERNQHVLTVSDPSSLVTELPVSELILPDLSKGDIARVRIDALGDQVFEGRIIRIHPNLDPVSRRGTIEVELEPVFVDRPPGERHLQPGRILFDRSLVGQRLPDPSEEGALTFFQRGDDGDGEILVPDGGPLHPAGNRLAEVDADVVGVQLRQFAA